jgi:hypothetical protein
LAPQQRQALAVQALAGAQAVTHLAHDFAVSRKFVYQQLALADLALTQAFDPPPADDRVLFHLPVTKAWLGQLTLGLVLICHSSLRGVVELLRDVFDYPLSLGTVHNIVAAAVAPARVCTQRHDLRRVRVGAHDEIFQAGAPVLVGADPLSSYCYLLSLEGRRDADTWGVHLLDLQARGFQPDCIVADADSALRAAQAQVLPEVPCRSDVFHALQQVQEVVRRLEEQAYRALQHCAVWQRPSARQEQRGRAADAGDDADLPQCRGRQDQAVALADEVAVLARWLRHDILGWAGPPHADRLALFDWIVAELQARRAQAPRLLSPLITYLRGQRDDRLAFAADLDRDLAGLAACYAVAVEPVRQLWAVQTLPADSVRRWHHDASLRRRLGARYWPLSQALTALRRRTVRASSLVENLNSRLRNYFLLRRHLGNDYLALLQFFLNHRRYPRSEHAERVGHSPAELMTGQAHPHWLERLGYKRFAQN